MGMGNTQYRRRIKRANEETDHKGDIVNDGREREILKAVMRLNHAGCTNWYFFEACGTATFLLTCSRTFAAKTSLVGGKATKGGN
jgi:hypothetical protein